MIAIGTKAARQARIVELVHERRIGTQEELSEILASEGITVTQPTLSKDLREVGAVRQTDADGASFYAIAGENPARSDQLARVVRELLLSAVASGNLAVLRTPRGAAKYLGSTLDRSGREDVLGTIAGDDTVMVITATTTGADAFVTELRELL